jgi:hypothetical protein
MAGEDDEGNPSNGGGDPQPSTKLKLQRDEIESLPEAARTLYVPTEDGKFRLDVTLPPGPGRRAFGDAQGGGGAEG